MTANIIDIGTIALTIFVACFILVIAFWRKNPFIHFLAINWSALWASFILSTNPGVFSQLTIYSAPNWVYNTLSTYPMLFVYLFLMLIGIAGMVEAAIAHVTRGGEINKKRLLDRGDRGL